MLRISRGIGYEADPRQVEKLLREIELEGASGDVTPSVKVLAHQVEDEAEAAKEVCWFMSRPTDITRGALERLARYLRARPRMVFYLAFQSAEGLECYTRIGRAARVFARVLRGLA